MKNMVIIKSILLDQHKEITFGLSTKIGAERKAPFYFNLSTSVGDDEKIVKENRELFYKEIGLEAENIVTQKQVHGDKINYADKGGFYGESDALITDKINLGLAISTADCTPIFIFDKKNKVIAAVHSGWRGTEKKILLKVLMKLKEDFNSSPVNLISYIGPSICQKNYEIGKEVAEKFEDKYLLPKEGKYLLNVSGINFDILINFGIPKENIQLSSYCTFEMKYLLHSYRRDGLQSGRAFGIIAVR
jgi:purine-nucleoside/S-methyl-5'-thioadenosine phosphorylase / adenosine deaminase